MWCAARALNLLTSGLYAGFLLSVLFLEIAVREVPGETYTLVQQVKHTNLNVLAAILLTGAIGSCLWLLLQTRADGSPRLLLTLGTLACALVALAVTLTVNVPINTAQMAWDPRAPPADWASVRDRWQVAHALRTMASLLGFGSSIAAVSWPGAVRR